MMDRATFPPDYVVQFFFLQTETALQSRQGDSRSDGVNYSQEQ